MGTTTKYKMMQKEINEEMVKEKIERVKSVSQIGTISRGIQDIFIESHLLKANLHLVLYE